jgi:hypothetical protein
MQKLRDQFSKIPWAYFGRKTPFSVLAKSLVPVGNHHDVAPAGSNDTTISSRDPAFENWIMDIQGTAFQVGNGKLLTCWHVVKALKIDEGKAYIQANTKFEGIPAKRFYPLTLAINFIDPRNDMEKSNVDVGMLISPAGESEQCPYEVPIVKWGDSKNLGVGDRVLIAGFPLGRDMFLSNSSNRAIVQPTFFDGIISAIIPATQPGETRLLQISSVALGGISGGVVCCAKSARVLGMIISGLVEGGVSLPITYAIPSEVLQPWADAISFKTEDGEIWK